MLISDNNYIKSVTWHANLLLDSILRKEIIGRKARSKNNNARKSVFLGLTRLSQTKVTLRNVFTSSNYFTIDSTTPFEPRSLRGESFSLPACIQNIIIRNPKQHENFIGAFDRRGPLKHRLIINFYISQVI